MRSTEGAGGGLVSPLPHRHALGEDVYEALKRSIMDHAIEPGARLSIDGLARDLRVSPTPVREALARLEADGLVVRAALRGYSASPVLTRTELEDLFGLRLLLEPWAAAAAAEHLDGDTARDLTTELRAAEQAQAAEPDGYEAVAGHDSRFHALLLRAAGNEAVRQAFERTHCHLHIFRLYYASGLGGAALAEHRGIAEAVLRRHPDGARSAMRAHLEASLARLVAAAR